MKNEDKQSFYDWLEKRPIWIQDYIYKAFNGATIDDKQINAYVSMCIKESQNIKFRYKHLTRTDSLEKNSSRVVSLAKISNIEGVNALSPNSFLAFAPEGVTVIYGYNGAGKTGYMRTIEAVCGNPAAPNLVPNVYVNSHIEQKCNCIVISDGVEQEYSVNLEKGETVSELIETDIFDTRISNSYVEKGNTVSYQPYIFTLLNGAAEVAGKISSILSTQIADKEKELIDIPQEYRVLDEARWLLSIDDKTTVPEAFKKWGPQEEERLGKLSKELNESNTSEIIQRDKNIISRIDSALEICNQIKNRFNQKSINDLKNKYETWCKAVEVKQDAEKVFAESADGFDEASIHVSSWKTMWANAKEYYEQILMDEKKTEFSEKGSICPLCHQELKGDTLDRFQAVNQYINGKVVAEAENSFKEYESYYKQIAGTEKIESIKGYLDGFVSDDIFKIISKCFLELNNIQLFTEFSDSSILKVIESFDISAVIKQLEELKVCTVEEKNRLLLLQNSEERQKKQAQVNHLLLVKWIYEHLDDINSTIQAEKEKKILLKAQKLTSTRAITSEVNELADKIITDSYIERFTDNIKYLAPKLNVTIERDKSQRGKTPYKLVLITKDVHRKKPELVLSEGEQRIAALAEFFADATGRVVSRPLIIDDPISSLDMNYESRATKKIAELAQKRQVIVFTHRVSLVVGLKDECDKAGVKFSEQHIVAREMYKGINSNDVIYTGKIPQQLGDLIRIIAEESKLEKDPKTSEFAIQSAKSRISQQFRICVERSVEDTLLGGMIKRFDKTIHTDKKISKLANITSEDCAIFDRLMTKYSYKEHSQPADSPTYEYTFDEMKADVEELQTWTKEYKKRMGWS